MSNEWLNEGPLLFPNVTVCHPLFFSKKNMRGLKALYSALVTIMASLFSPALNVSDELGSYLVYAVTPGVASVLRGRWQWEDSSVSQKLDSRLKSAEEELQLAMRTNGMDITQLFRALAFE